ncbi:GH24 family phage-related lysozyme (muramidase) [Novosphingobium kunmingense]|uniref:Lysozyme n=1 Tax=Novosphingobium kunmingense TaxID=1211806 RepID=A0A2N0HKQ4_9SPHN|nr:lysozyme [Novosphingobium kunmingense]PKB19543.1 GH24 family phage-related lysozyme (muramidase) [Novosphingobium kunmingense]
MPFELDYFAALRRMVANRADCAPAATPPFPAPSPGTPPSPPVQMEVSATGTALIRRFEGCALKRADGLIEAYPDPGTGGAPWTIGWGTTGAGISPGTIWTQEQCDARLAADLRRHAADVRTAIGGAPTSQAQFDALVSFHFNTGAIARATLTRLHRAGDHAGAALQFGRWVFAGGTRLRGLERRRAAEAKLYRGA